MFCNYHIPCKSNYLIYKNKLMLSIACQEIPISNKLMSNSKTFS